MDRMLLAYTQGIFPWPGEGTPMLWWSPPQRAMMHPAQFHVPRRLESLLRSGRFHVTVDRAFDQVMRGCADAIRPGGQQSTWLIPAMQQVYQALHQRGLAHSVEVFEGEALVGGVFGISLGAMFFAESMFYRVSNASKVALASLAQLLQARSYDWMECQLLTPHLAQFGFHEAPRDLYLQRLQQALSRPDAWTASPMTS